MTQATRLAALVKLFDDDSDVVRRAVLEELRRYGATLERRLRALDEGVDEERLQALLDEVAGRQLAAGGPEDEATAPAAPACAQPSAPVATDEDDDPGEDGEGAPPAPRLEVGQLVRHKRYGYRGVIVALDPRCRADDSWYHANRTRPGRDQPWYHVLVHESEKVTYAAQSSLLPDESMAPVRHPWVPYFFRSFADGRYQRNERSWPGW